MERGCQDSRGECIFLLWAKRRRLDPEDPAVRRRGWQDGDGSLDKVVSQRGTNHALMRSAGGIGLFLGKLMPWETHLDVVRATNMYVLASG